MKTTALLLALTAAAAEAHYVFPNVANGNQRTGDWQAVRQTTNWQSNGPLTDVTSRQLTCYELSPGRAAPQTINVTAGGTVSFAARSSISHPGPLSGWLGFVPQGKTAATWDGSGSRWIKIFQDKPTVNGQGLSWPSQGKTTVNFEIPRCVPAGEYLLRVEHIALHSASSVGGAQLYISCAQVRVTGGGNEMPQNGMVAIPGVYKPTDPGLVVNIYYPVPTNYRPPGPEPWKCGGGRDWEA
ncbi:cellulose-growth-specific protein [Magnaporthiopsis poae ATCC 64411]|uniref:lytic cellulose monooxygenase (C4-dehydrogenating) n=1 Tax=Magnaporthiopsis poae (strain ATCC 64411 / 73-15) TaxID=644358 RepID=A0A0C4EFI4_MAGP6|nr:cellulose-growth-specific protein [Magnaporthiopsis poae ATCC 64411]